MSNPPNVGNPERDELARLIYINGGRAVYSDESEWIADALLAAGYSKLRAASGSPPSPTPIGWVVVNAEGGLASDQIFSDERQARKCLTSGEITECEDVRPLMFGDRRP